MSPSSQSASKQQFSVLLDPKLIERVMEYTDMPGDAVEEGLRLWLSQQQGAQSPAVQAPGRSPANLSRRRRASAIPSPQDYPPLVPQRSQTGAIAPVARTQKALPPNRTLDLAPSPKAPQPSEPQVRQLRKAFSRPNMPHKDSISPRRRVDHLPIDERRSSNDDETGWLV